MKIQFLLFLLIINYTYSQDKLFLYDYKFISDSTNRMNVKNEIMILNIQKDRTEFYSYERYSSDSIQLSESKKGNMAIPKNKVLINQHFAKNLKPQSFQNQGIALFFLYFSQVRGLSRTLK